MVLREVSQRLNVKLRALAEDVTGWALGRDLFPVVLRELKAAVHRGREWRAVVVPDPAARPGGRKAAGTEQATPERAPAALGVPATGGPRLRGTVRRAYGAPASACFWKPSAAAGGLGRTQCRPGSAAL